MRRRGIPRKSTPNKTTINNTGDLLEGWVVSSAFSISLMLTPKKSINVSLTVYVVFLSVDQKSCNAIRVTRSMTSVYVMGVKPWFSH